jgi:hypothetical protein
MRQRAEAATGDGPWLIESDGAGTLWIQTTMTPIACAGDEDEPSVIADAEYIAAMHPGVALAVAAWLKNVAHFYRGYQGPLKPDGELAHAQAIARAYLGEATS